METNVLYHGDCYRVLREQFDPVCVDLIYLDPPFNSNRNFSVLFKDRPGQESEAQQEAFSDMWHWSELSLLAFQELVSHCHSQSVVATLQALERIVGHSAMLAYLTSMTGRLIEMHRVLKPTGSLWLHCDTTASHYLKLVLDAIFGPENFRNEVIWKRTSSHNDARRRMGDLCDTLLFYSKTDRYTFNPQYGEYDPAYVERDYFRIDESGRRYRTTDLRSPNPRPNLMYDYKGYKPHPNGWSVSRERMEQLDAEGKLHYPSSPTGRILLRKYLDEAKGMPVGNIWTDIQPVNPRSKERLGYPTQKPVALLERVILMSSNEEDVVLDPYCGCGTAVVAAHSLRRRWMGIDITRVATTVIKTRLEQEFNDLAIHGVPVIGDPNDAHSATRLANADKHEFQIWACGLVGAYPLTKKGSDGGIDGFLNFFDLDEKPHRALVQVKAGNNVGVKDVREFRAVMEREKATLGFFLSLAPFKETMIAEALEMGHWKAHGGVSYPRLQLLSVIDLLRRTQRPRLPVQEKRSILNYQAPKRGRKDDQPSLDLG